MSEIDLELTGGTWVNVDGKGILRYVPNIPAPGPKKRIVKCGTLSGHRRHIQRGETPCLPCLDASRDYTRKRRGVEKIRPLKPHGTHAAYQRHMRVGSVPCDECVVAERVLQRERRAAKRAKREQEEAA